MHCKNLPIAAVMLSIALSTTAAWAEPTTRPAADPEYRIGEVDIQTVAPFTYAFLHAKTTFAKLRDTIGELMPRLQQQIGDGAVHPSGTVVFTYTGATDKPDQEFDLRIGIMIDRKVAEGSGIDSSDEPAMKCATLLYRGSVAHLKEAYGKLYTEIGTRGLKATPVSRELYLYWEGPDSPNNVIQLQVSVN